MAAIERGIVDWSRRLRVVEGPVSFRRKQAVVLILTAKLASSGPRLTLHRSSFTFTFHVCASGFSLRLLYSAPSAWEDF
jgi:hypothetical protein